MKKITCLILCCLLLVGCDQIIERDPTPNPNQFLGDCIAAAGYAAVTGGGEVPTPNPGPGPSPDKVVPTSECTMCLDESGKPVGYVGDGTIRTDCGFCDFDGDGDPHEPDSIHYRSNKAVDGEESVIDNIVENLDDPSMVQILIETMMAEANVTPAEPTPYQTCHYVDWHYDTDSALNQAEKENKKIFVWLRLNNDVNDIWCQDELIDNITKNYVPLQINSASEQVGPDWAKYCSDPNLITSERELIGFTKNAFCVLNTEGVFVSEFYELTQENLVKLDDIVVSEVQK